MKKIYKLSKHSNNMENKKFKDLSIEEMEENLKISNEFDKEMVNQMDLVFNLKI